MCEKLPVWDGKNVIPRQGMEFTFKTPKRVNCVETKKGSTIPKPQPSVVKTFTKGTLINVSQNGKTIYTFVSQDKGGKKYIYTL